jgi:SAM-dependent methyltransferase
MFEQNVQRLLDSISPSDVVLDIGGWASPFNRANFVLDAQPYETRGFYRTFGGPAFQGPAEESFTKDTWICRDICDHEPYPFADQSIDVVICSHTLEDVRDPVWVCREMNRIAKRGYIETPSRVAESCRGWEHPRLAGLSHHRWFVEMAPSRVVFRMKPHRIHSQWRLSLPSSYLKQLSPEQRVTWLFWEGGLEAVEGATPHGIEQIDAELAAYVASVYPYPAWRLAVERWQRRSAQEWGRLRRGVARRLTKGS